MKVIPETKFSRPRLMPPVLVRAFSRQKKKNRMLRVTRMKNMPGILRELVFSSGGDQPDQAQVVLVDLVPAAQDDLALFQVDENRVDQRQGLFLLEAGQDLGKSDIDADEFQQDRA